MAGNAAEGLSRVVQAPAGRAASHLVSVLSFFCGSFARKYGRHNYSDLLSSDGCGASSSGVERGDLSRNGRPSSERGGSCAARGCSRLFSMAAANG